MLYLAAIAAIFSVAYGAPASGSCLCSSASSLNARDAAGTSAHIVTHIAHNECFKFNGGVHTTGGYTWYELQDVHGHHRVWAASNYLHVSAASHCSGGGSSGGSGGSGGSHTFASGIVSQKCMQCICMQESGCKPIHCHWDVNSDSCGYFQIKEGYWHDCGRPGGSWKACADDLHCASQCVQNYMKRYAAHYHCPLTCEGFAREHNGGPNGCHSSSTLGYWSHVRGHSGCSHVV